MSNKLKRPSPYDARPLVGVQRPCSAGFTMVELVIAVLILGIVAAVGAPRFAAALDHARARSAALRVESDLKYARQLARQKCSPQTVAFDVATSSYELVGAADRDRQDRSYIVSLSDDQFSSEIASADFNGTTSVTFDIHGHADNAGNVEVRSGDRQETVTVDTFGRTSIP